MDLHEFFDSPNVKASLAETVSRELPHPIQVERVFIALPHGEDVLVLQIVWRALDAPSGSWGPGYCAMRVPGVLASSARHDPVARIAMMMMAEQTLWAGVTSQFNATAVREASRRLSPEIERQIAVLRGDDG
jgi:hypothetical protein